MTIKDNDLILISQVKLFDNHKAFEKIVLKYQSQIRRLFMNLTLRNKDLSNDLAQEAFIKAYLNIHSFKGTSKFSTWLYRIAYNIFLDYRKTNYRTFVDTLPENNISYAYEDKYQNEDGIELILHILRNEERDAIILSYIEEVTHKEISSIMNIPIGTVKTHIKRGREKILKHLTSTAYEYQR